jgi:hypothetical protein
VTAKPLTVRIETSAKKLESLATTIVATARSTIRRSTIVGARRGYKMSRKDYKLIVKILNRQAQHMTLAAFMSLVEDFCTELRVDNERFNKEKFMNALLTGDL